MSKSLYMKKKKTPKLTLKPLGFDLAQELVKVFIWTSSLKSILKSPGDWVKWLP